MKRKIDTIKGKRLVMGGSTNTLSKDEILVTETSSGIELKERSADGKIKDLAGGGNSGGNTPLNLIYLNAEKMSPSNMITAILVKIHQKAGSNGAISWGEQTFIEGGYFYGAFHNERDIDLLAVAIDLDFPFATGDEGMYTMREAYHKAGIDDDAMEEMLAPLRITKEEFYNMTSI